MFDILNIIFMAASALVDIRMYALQETPMPPLGGGVAHVEFSTAAPGWRVRPRTEEELCRFTGVAVAYERTWEERYKSGDIESVVPPEPGVAAGYAVLINKKECDGKAPEAMLRVGVPLGAKRMVRLHSMDEHAILNAYMLNGMREDTRPKWLEQVIKSIDVAAETDPVAKDFVTFVRSAAVKDIATTKAQ